MNDEMIGDGCPGPLTKFIQKKFFEMTYENLAGEKWWSWQYFYYFEEDFNSLNQVMVDIPHGINPVS